MLIDTINGTVAEIPCNKCDKGTIRGYLGETARCDLCGYGLRLGKQRNKNNWDRFTQYAYSKRTVLLQP